MIAKCSDGFETIEKTIELKPDVIVLDTKINGIEYAELTRNINEQLPRARIIILTFSDNDNDLFSALKAGARGYMTKDVQVKEITGAIFGVYLGEVIISSRMAGQLLQEFRHIDDQIENPVRNFDGRLTKREKEILTFVAKGNTNREIADTLFITENTVKVHLSRILEKLRVHNRQQAAYTAIEMGLINWYSRPKVAC